MTDNSRRQRLASMLALVFTLAVGTAQRGMAQAAADHWQFTVSPYLLAPHMNGKVGVGPIPPVTVDVGPSEIFSHLQFGAMVFVQARKGPWAIGLDGLYMNLSEDLAKDASRASGTVGMKQAAFQLLVLREVTRGVELGVSGRLNVISSSIDARVAVADTFQRGTSGTKVWFDPLLAARLTVPGTGKWHLALEADVGGFGVGSSFAWQVVPIVGYRFSQLFELAGSYRAMGMDYSTGEGKTAFSYDMRIFGPLLGFAFHF